jgi:sulfur-carrier protein
VAGPVTMVTFVVPPALRRWIDDRPEVRVFAVAPSGTDVPTLGAALDTLRRQHPSLEERLRHEDGRIRRHISMFVCGENARQLGGLSCGLPPGAEVYVMPALG